MAKRRPTAGQGRGSGGRRRSLLDFESCGGRHYDPSILDWDPINDHGEFTFSEPVWDRIRNLLDPNGTRPMDQLRRQIEGAIASYLVAPPPRVGRGRVLSPQRLKPAPLLRRAKRIVDAAKALRHELFAESAEADQDRQYLVAPWIISHLSDLGGASLRERRSSLESLLAAIERAATHIQPAILHDLSRRTGPAPKGHIADLPFEMLACDLASVVQAWTGAPLVFSWGYSADKNCNDWNGSFSEVLDAIYDDVPPLRRRGRGALHPLVDRVLSQHTELPRP